MTAHPVVAAAPALRAEDATDRIARLFDTHQEALYRLARRLADSAEDARDLVQETFLRAARNPGRVPIGQSQEEAWLVRVLINIRRDQWRRRKVRIRSAPVVDASPEAITQKQESELMARAEVWRALNRLHPRRRAVVVMHELDGASIPAIAALLGISAITVRWHLSRARRDLRRILCPQMEKRHEDRS